jgi:hypothetical protein
MRAFVPQPDDFPSIEFYACRAKPRGNQMINFACILNEEVEPIRGDATDHKVTTRGDLASLADRPVRLEFFLRHAEFYGIELHETR